MSKGRKKYIVVGIDEAGRGPLAGPLAVAGIATTARISNFKFLISKPNLKLKIKNLKFLKGIRDSKKLSAKQREEWQKVLCEKFECHSVLIGAKIIDKVGISKATKIAMARVLKKFSFQRPRGSLILLDGSLFAPKNYLQQTIIRGDEKIPLISAASIIAKTRRDHHMLNLHKKFPQYCFDRHKGYGTKLHYKMLKKHGLCPFHRRSFCKFICREQKIKLS
jgi:ribonuclease HII